MTFLNVSHTVSPIIVAICFKLPRIAIISPLLSCIKVITDATLDNTTENASLNA